MKAFEKQKKKQEAEELGKIEEKERSKVESFVNMEKRLTTKTTSAFTVTKEKVLLDLLLWRMIKHRQRQVVSENDNVLIYTVQVSQPHQNIYRLYCINQT